MCPLSSLVSRDAAYAPTCHDRRAVRDGGECKKKQRACDSARGLGATKTFGDYGFSLIATKDPLVTEIVVAALQMGGEHTGDNPKVLEVKWSYKRLSGLAHVITVAIVLIVDLDMSTRLQL